jgi:hypothetical protein
MNSSVSPEVPRVLLVSSSGGHWTQLNRLRPCFDGWSKTFVCTDAEYGCTLEPGESFYHIPDATRWSKLRLVWQAVKLFGIMLLVRPRVVISTGAAPGYFALVFGHLLGCKTIWVDSIANVDEMSLSGKQVRRFAHLWLTQWEHLSVSPGGPQYFGSIV